ncbi:hypothetical protein PHYBLDRAFT_150391 [Phycomyces blakesleeanus NRRL 1555(-)]|uniref:Helitron helicase-like domain-containing protein n=1 Tax=Phycomyces blakesleeanus (strain ATCC 8743b / DSM 1359 / FGSC 10004 / NBRC 33097 / NRRL 1555) TaxID=763407 RepID=A0A162ZSL6_PHYB8|nr:hypothetical protein PHYBLDRAFT_150391 [Phycomyces blakesleeanus NRRL 1555(-)]OAD68801.1 hypothetical protein PHYBLDRAFT_150391 [Phycomyces blakesleeanus NRRL 1555(-)]|eukprot:XP_018286841.1 hypothetical protein PHYBLDRAFT_150391 [Phycomyces blakesleeanus NRRL 1555(-)]
MDIECRFCGAMMWAHEKNSRSSLRSSMFSMCCNKGKHVLPQIEPTPTGIAELLNYRTRDRKKFLENIQSYNSTMSFTSLGAKIDTSVGNNINGAYNFWIHGTICHRIGSILPVTESDITHTKFAKIYIYDSAAQIDQRQYHSSQLERSVLEKIQSILMETNPFVHLFRTMNQISWEKRQSIDLTLHLVAEGPQDQRWYNAPTASEIAVLIMNNEEGTSRDIVLHTRANFQQNINEYHQSYDALHYVLLFPHGEDGWTIDASSLSEEHVTHLLYLFGHLFQQYIVDMYTKVEHNRLYFITSNQNCLHVDLYSGIQDAVIHNDCNLANLGKKAILPYSFIGSLWYMAQLYQDSMSIVRRFGKPDLFITFTCNSKWPEITNSLLAGQKANDRPDLCSRRGLSHVHILLILQPQDKPKTIEDFDKIVLAEIPDPETEPLAYETVKQCMMHGPYGKKYPKASCMKNGICSKNYLKKLCNETSNGHDRAIVCVQLMPTNSAPQQQQEHVNKVNEFLDARYVSDSEAWWRIFSFKLHQEYRSHQRLSIHLENA